MKRTVHRFIPNALIRMRPSKSVLHRALICAALASGTSEILNFAVSDDISATMGALEALGLCRFEQLGSVCRVLGNEQPEQLEEINCRESGSTLRFLFPQGCDGTRHCFTGKGRLLERPFGPYEEICKAQGIVLEKSEKGITVQGQLRSGEFEIDGDVSSQFITGLLFALPLLESSSVIHLRTPLESAPYVAITTEVMEAFGVSVGVGEDTYHVTGGANFRPRTYAVEGDYSHAAFFAVAAALAGQVQLAGLHSASSQGDREILDIVQSAGANIDWDEGTVCVTHDTLSPFEVDVSQIPDLVPALAVLACGARGESRLNNAARLRLKESDRLAALEQELQRLGGDVAQAQDSLIIRGTGRLSGGEASSHGDHRIAMALAVAALISDAPVTIEGAEAVSKSAPQFFHEWAVLRGDRL